MRSFLPLETWEEEVEEDVSAVAYPTFIKDYKS
jgi:hypothetical protein